MKMNKKFGFTLAEVLITLGIIGVVAAMTIPTLIANTNSAKHKTQFKKSLSTLNQAVRMGIAQYDFNFATADQTCGGATDDPNVKASVCALFNGTLAGATYFANLKTAKIPGSTTATYNPRGGSWINQGTWSGYLLADGSIVAFPRDSKECTEASWCGGFIDVNGFAKPNEEVPCNGTSSPSYRDNGGTVLTNTTTCDLKNVKYDIIPVDFYDDIVQPGTVGMSILREGK